tara:strand:- start:3718 stop:3882 length:165 start_codon:yes stop_codon:yes gene_type:complete
MKTGSIDLILLLIIFSSLQAWWIIPILKKKDNEYVQKDNLNNIQIEKLEELYKK